MLSHRLDSAGPPESGLGPQPPWWPRHMAERILVADDDPSSLEGLRVLLAIWGYEVETASDGWVALQKISAVEPKAVITDVVMPKLNGLELLGALRIERPGMPVIVLTGQGSLDTLL